MGTERPDGKYCMHMRVLGLRISFVNPRIVSSLEEAEEVFRVAVHHQFQVSTIRTLSPMGRESWVISGKGCSTLWATVHKVEEDCPKGWCM